VSPDKRIICAVECGTTVSNQNGISDYLL